VFEHFLSNLLGVAKLDERPNGVAFFRVAKSTYPLHSIGFVGLNIPIRAQSNRYLQCAYTDTWVKQSVTAQKVSPARLTPIARAFQEPVEWSSDPESQVVARESFASSGWAERKTPLLTIPLQALHGECAAVCLEGGTHDDWKAQKENLLQEFRILGNYFHHQLLRIYGHDSERELIVSARELDCLKWMAVGKTAWEASVILGITERTVRFHLNAAREKLGCTTTTQAVAKAVSQQLITL
jgi:DNA-binding CsgD family transcriptional regulator